MSFFFHEQLYRTDRVMALLKDYAITLCGAGALGANLAENLARSGFGQIRVIDCDRIEERNLSTQPYYRSDVGAFKAKVLANHLYRAIGTKIDAQTQTLTAENAPKLLKDSQLIVDLFDNSASRQAVKAYAATARIPCLHAGLSTGYAEIIWNDGYRVPSPTQDDICDYPLARNLVMLTIAVTSEVLVTYITTGIQQNYTVTLNDLTLLPLPA
jgi:molybdopterin-synthase adenylyltransferase